MTLSVAIYKILLIYLEKPLRKWDLNLSGKDNKFFHNHSNYNQLTRHAETTFKTFKDDIE